LEINEIILLPTFALVNLALLFSLTLSLDTRTNPKNEAIAWQYTLFTNKKYIAISIVIFSQKGYKFTDI